MHLSVSRFQPLSPSNASPPLARPPAVSLRRNPHLHYQDCPSVVPGWTASRESAAFLTRHLRIRRPRRLARPPHRHRRHADRHHSSSVVCVRTRGCVVDTKAVTRVDVSSALETCRLVVADRRLIMDEIDGRSHITLWGKCFQNMTCDREDILSIEHIMQLRMETSAHGKNDMQWVEMKYGSERGKRARTRYKTASKKVNARTKN